MLTDKLPEDKSNLLVDKVNVEVVISDDSLSPMALILPPVEDLNEMKWLEDKNFSLKDFTDSQTNKRAERFELELEKLQRKTKRFGHSPVYHNRIANLAAAAGQYDLEHSSIQRAFELSGDKFFVHRQGDFFIHQEKWREAFDIFKAMDLKNDVYANLRLASLSVHSRDVDSAENYVEQAVSLNPLDFGARLFQGALRLLKGNYDLAVHSFRLAGEEKPTSSVVQTNLAVAYMGLDLREKALVSLRRAVALNPLNATAVMMLADVAYLLGENQDAVPSLRYYVQFEQKKAALWSRLARALLEIGQVNESIEALKRQGSIENTGAVWNNLGVAYHKKKDYRKSLSSFKHAMTIDTGRDFFLAARNAAVTFSSDKTNQELLDFTKLLLVEDTEHLITKDKVLSDIAAMHIYALARTDNVAEAVAISEQLIFDQNVVFQLRVWAATGLLSFYGINLRYKEKAIELSKELVSWVPSIPKSDFHLKDRLLNNIAFTYAEFGYVEDAEKYLNLISHLIHKEAYPTAVLGLIQFRKGNLEKATSLYEEAIHISSLRVDKARIRQKLNLELAGYWENSDTSRSIRYLTKVLDAKDGDKDLMRRAKELLVAFKSKPSLLSK